MKKYLILLIVVLCVAQTAIGFTIKGGVSYTVNDSPKNRTVIDCFRVF